MIKTKKELGQFFSGRAVATLLAHLSKYQHAETIIDPMCGVGDMLIACSDIEQKKLVGVEVDEGVYSHAVKRLQSNTDTFLINDDAFSIQTFSQLDQAGYDLVITNPPYVRYQSLPDDWYTIIRRNLLTAVDTFQTLKGREKDSYRTLIEHFSGLSDLAVPSWLLCCLLVKRGGKIAMVLPETWLSRDYSFIVKYILIKFFRIEFIVEDAHSVWFKPAQVKTILLVGERIEQRNLNDWDDDDRFCYINVYSKGFSDDSVVSIQKHQPEVEFMKFVKERRSLSGFFDLKEIKINRFARGIQTVCKDYGWYQKLEPAFNTLFKAELNALSDLHSTVPVKNLNLTTLPAIGVNVSQGLRTGANFFFYMDAEKVSKDKYHVFPNESFLKTSFIVDAGFVKEVVRKQSDLDDGYSLAAFEAKGVVLTLQRYVTKADQQYLSKLNSQLSDAFELMDTQLDKYISAAKAFKLPERFKVDFIYNLSAVRPNMKEWSNRDPNTLPRFWYMLPEFTRRHTPDLFIPRVNNSSTVTRINPKSKFIIDANFSTLWLENNSSYNEYALLSLLNSTWCVVTMEEYGTVMGGGALKLEATQLKKMPIPVLGENAITKLSSLGIELAEKPNDHEYVIKQIDAVILSELGVLDVARTTLDLYALKARLLARRTKKNIYESIHSE